MTSAHTEASWFDERETLPLHDLAELSGLTEREVLELVEYGAFAPTDESAVRWVFSVRTLTVARTARRLREDYALEPHGVALLLAYLDRIRELEAELCAVRAQLPR